LQLPTATAADGFNGIRHQQQRHLRQPWTPGSPAWEHSAARQNYEKVRRLVHYSIVMDTTVSVSGADPDGQQNQVPIGFLDVKPPEAKELHESDLACTRNKQINSYLTYVETFTRQKKEREKKEIGS
jgi:hypothetical protein